MPATLKLGGLVVTLVTVLIEDRLVRVLIVHRLDLVWNLVIILRSLVNIVILRV